jgi:hypothetical protein
MSEYGSSRFGWDAPARIATSTTYLQEATELLPDATLYNPIPFLPTITDGSGSASDIQLSDDGHPIWSRTPSAVDLMFWQGDDVVIPLYFDDPSVLGDDMAAGFEWFAQVRTWPYYSTTLVNTFTITASYHPSIPSPPTAEYTIVEMFLPRSENIHWGCYRWELYSISPQDYSRFPKPDDVDAADWPPPDGLRTWLYGNCTITPRTASTDFLPTPPASTNGGQVLGPGGYFVGPNGRVP